ncbi:unnamed protein product [Prunus armeniaca]|uniref:Uncharacterized protein n=1 Tax=Prunus armeniaca TaxID=36596 RepID=A0A6J5VJH6_PRUAR|nr:unnamed protein product [Prunus armeniaca]
MGLVLEIGVQIRKFAIISKRTCYRLVGNHPFLVGMLLFLIFLYRSFPFAFSLLVSTSPVLVCTAVLLGTLLSFGQPNIPEIEKEEKLTHDIASLKTGVSRDDTFVVDRDGSFSTERFSGKTRDVVSSEVEDHDPQRDSKISSEVEDHDGSSVYVPLINENLKHTQNEKRVIEGVERELDSLELDNQRNSHDERLGIEGVEWDVEAVEQQYTLVKTVEDDISPRESYRADHLDSSLGVGGSGGDDEADEDVNDEASDSESDRAESSSPDASMADILPILDELHPLLDSEAPEPAHMSHDESESDRSNAGSVESDKETENLGGGIQGDDGVDYNDGDEEEVQGGKEDESESAIIWTEDDQKNLMDLGNLELERNQRLENLIARRRARKSFKITAEKNLIDFDSADLPFNIAPISTTRHNPFDLPYNSFDNLGLPPIPGSAPSILLPRRNPFDLPYESNEEKPDLKGDHFEQEFMAFHSKDAFFRRHESFSLGPSSLGHAKQERQDFKWRPVFVPERLASEGTSSSLFQRQSSEVSDSKLSSLPDTESVSSAADLDERKFSEQYFTKEAEVISNIYHAPDLVEHESHSSEDVDSLDMEQAGKRDVQHDDPEIKLGELQNPDPSLSGTGVVATLVEHISNEIHLKPEPVEEDKTSRSSSSSLSEVDENISDVMKGGSTSLEAEGDIIKEFVISPQPSIEESEVQFMSRAVDDNERKEPVYDSSPLPTEKILSFNSISSDMQADISEMVTPQASTEMYVPFVDQDSETPGESTEKGTSGYVEINGSTSKVHASDEIERSLGTCNQLNLACPHLEEEIYLPKNLNVKTASSDSSYQSVLSQKMPSSEQEKVLSWSDKSMVEPCFDDHAEAHVVNEEVDDVKEIDAGLLSELDAVGDFSVKEVVGEPLHTDEPIQEEANVLSTEFGDSNLSELNLELLVPEARSIEDIDMAFKQIQKGLDVEEVILPSIVDNQLAVEASKNTVQTSSEFPIVEARSLEDIVITLNQVSESSVNVLPQLMDSEDQSTELPLEYIHTILKQVSEGNSVGELPNPSYSNDGSEEVGTTAVSSLEEIASRNIVSSVQENITAHDALEQVSESHVDELPKPTSNSEGLEEVGINAMGSMEEIVSSNIVSSALENISTQTALKQVSESHVDERPKQTSDLKEGSAEVGTTAMGSTNETASSNIVSSEQENFTTHTALKQVSGSHVDELPKPTANSKEGLEEVGDAMASSTKEIASTTTEPGVQEAITTPTALKQVSGSNVDELLKSSNSQDGFEEVGPNATDLPIENVRHEN